MPPPEKNQSKAALPAKKKKKNKKKQSKWQKQKAALSASLKQASSANNNGVEQVKNPLLEAHKEFMKHRCTPEERDNFFSNTRLDSDRRAELWMEQADTGENLVNSYSWAIPDDRALRILKHFSPLVEIGCGANAYWCRMMEQCGIDIVGYDLHPEEGGQITSNDSGDNKTKKKRQRESGDSFQVQQGGPEVLATKELRKSGRTLFLCYSDEEALQAPPPPPEDEEEEEDEDEKFNDEDSEEEDRMTTLGVECLKNYTGDYVIHVGELFGDSLALEQSPWGRSSGPDFQQFLAATFHCVLKASLPNWIHVRDTISVWKRSETCSIVFEADSDEDEEDEEGDDEVEYKHIPVSERLPTDIAAPCLAHLLALNQSSSQEEPQKAASVGSPPKKGHDKKATPKKRQAAKEPDSDEEDSSNVDDTKDGSSDDEPRNSSKKPPSKKARKDSDDDGGDNDDDEYAVEW